MAELWRELIEKDSPEIAGGLSLLRVSISRKTGQMLVQLASERILSRNELKRLQRTMEGAFPAVGLKVEVKYPALKEAVSADIGRAAKLLKELLSHKCPGAVHFLDTHDGAWKLEGETLHIHVSSSEGADYLRMKNVGGMLEEELDKLFGIKAYALAVSH